MNRRFLTDQQKALNKQERWRRHARTRAWKRRVTALAQLRDPFLPLCRDILSANAAIELLYGDVKAINRHVGRLNRIAHPPGPFGLQSAADSVVGQEIPRPSRVLRRANRGLVSALINRPTILQPADFVGLERALEIAHELVLQGIDRDQILQFLASPKAIGLSPKACAKLAVSIDLEFTEAEIRSIEQATMLTNSLMSARALYRAMTATEGLKPAKGDWGFFEAANLHAALPGLHLPHVLHRCSYLVRLRYRNGLLSCLDLHSSTYRPLCRHPVD